MADRRANAGQRGYDARWHALQARFLNVHPLCARCGCPAELVDHVVPVRKDRSRRLDPSNLQSLCRQCHGVKTARRDFGKSSGVMPDTDSDGWPLDAAHPWNQQRMVKK